jgi:hypothetical protein
MRKHILAFLTACLFTNAFAQDEPRKLAVYVSGASDASVNKALGGKLLAAIAQGGYYAEIADPVAFQDELAKSGKGDIAQISQAGQRHGADYVCAVNMIEAFGAYSITARLVKTSDSQMLKTGSADRSLKSLDDITAVSNELARQLLPSGSQVAMMPAAVAVALKQYERMYNINEVLFKVREGFPAQLKDCSSKLAKEMALAAMPFGKKAAPVEPKSFVKQCAMDGIKNELPDGFPNADKVIGSLDNFMQAILNTASAGGGLDPKKLVNAIGSMDIAGLVNDVKKLASGECMVDEPYEPPAAPPAEERTPGGGRKKSMVSFGIRAGINLSHTFTEYTKHYSNGLLGSGEGNYDNIFGMQFGFVVDFALSGWFHIQPGFMYIQKGMEDGHDGLTAHYLELPLLLSIKLSALRLNAGPYAGMCLAGDGAIFGSPFDYGISSGAGFDIGMFHIGAFYEYGLLRIRGSSGNYQNFRRNTSNTSYNRTLGFNLGVNL